MKPYYLFPIFVFCLFSCSESTDKQETSYLSYGLNQRVKSVQVTTYEAESRFGEVVKGDVEILSDDVYLAVFNENGLVSEKTDFDDDGSVDWKHIYSYNADNLLVDAKDYDDEGTLYGRESFTYDGEIIETTIIYSKEGEEQYKLEYSNDGKVITEVRFYLEGSLSSISKYEYKKGKMVKNVTYDKDGKESGRTEYSYDKNGNQTQILSNDRNIQIEYNDNNLVTSITNAIYTTYGSLYWHSNKKEEEITYFEYEYDKKGNWIKRTSFSGPSKTPNAISERVITY